MAGFRGQFQPREREPNPEPLFGRRSLRGLQDPDHRPGRGGGGGRGEGKRAVQGPGGGEKPVRVFRTLSATELEGGGTFCHLRGFVQPCNGRILRLPPPGTG